MHYALLIYAAPEAAANAPQPPAGDGVIDRWLDYTRAMKESGSMAGAEQLRDTETATCVRVRAGERLLTDGPFAETKEHLLGFYLVDVPDLDAAVEWAARMPAVRHGTIEVRPVIRDAGWRQPME
ncbi:MAG TPA: YciI family protein [Candidatus Dormibacteraeota bacterium]